MHKLTDLDYCQIKDFLETDFTSNIEYQSSLQTICPSYNPEG